MVTRADPPHIAPVIAPATSASRPAGATVLHVCTRYARGGSEQRLRDMIDALPDWDHHVVLGQDSDIERFAAEFPTVTVRVEPNLRRAPHPTRDLAAYRSLRTLLRTTSFDLVCTHQSKAGFLGRLAARGRARATVHSLSMANFGAGYSRLESFGFRLAERLLAGATTAYAVVGVDLAERFVRIGVKRSKLHVIRSAARLPAESIGYTAARSRCAAQYGLPAERPWILYLGSLEARKNVLSLPVVLQHTLLHWADEAPPVLVVAGDGPLRAELDKLLRQMDLAEDSMLLGHVADPTPLVTGSNVLVLLSDAEGLPQVLVQASAVQLPFVAFEVDGVDELLRRGAGGRVVEPGDVLAAADEVLDLLQRGPRHELSLELDEWNRDHILASYRSLFTRLLADATP